MVYVSIGSRAANPTFGSLACFVLSQHSVMNMLSGSMSTC
jgi:hypothetical protein